MKITYQLSEIDGVAAMVLSQTKSNLLLFKGDIGVGKTTLIKALLKQLGSIETAVSPTFSIVNEYHTQNNEVIYHFDLYRMEKPQEVLDIGIEEYLNQGDWILIEWPEVATAFFDETAQNVVIREKSDKKRELEII